MPSVLIFEDSFETIFKIHETLKNTPYEIVGEADSLFRAQQFLSQIISAEIEVNVLLLDGNLSRHHQPIEFRHTFPLDGTEPIKKSLFRKEKPIQPREIVIPNEEEGIGGDARMIRKIMKTCDINIPIIGISGDSMRKRGVDVDLDIGKYNLRENLLPALQQLTG